jgi:predicted HicB family RNase H-like nuclease
MAQKYTEARKEGNKRWDEKNLDRISLALPKGKKEEIKSAAAAAGESMNQYISAAIDQRMEREK